MLTSEIYLIGTEMYFKMLDIFRQFICREAGVLHCCKLLYRGSEDYKQSAGNTAGHCWTLLDTAGHGGVVQHEPQRGVRPGDLGRHQVLPAPHLQGIMI